MKISETYNAIPFMQDSIQEYYDEEGKSLRKAFLKAPLDFFRITSKYTNARFHPILKRYRAHHGIDYAAPTGTPVKSIGAGVVIAKGFQGRKLYKNPSQFGLQHHLYAPV